MTVALRPAGAALSLMTMTPEEREHDARPCEDEAQRESLRNRPRQEIPAHIAAVRRQLSRPQNLPRNSSTLRAWNSAYRGTMKDAAAAPARPLPSAQAALIHDTPSHGPALRRARP